MDSYVYRNGDYYNKMKIKQDFYLQNSTFISIFVINYLNLRSYEANFTLFYALVLV